MNRAAPTRATVRERMSDILTVVMALCAVIVAGLAIQNRFFPRDDAAPSSLVEGEELRRSGSWIGPPDAKLVIVEFSDFQCPFCAQAQQNVQAFRADHPGQVSVVYRQFPLKRIHRHAYAAARASVCAARQGRFEAYHDQLFQNQDSIGTTPWNTFAVRAGVRDTVVFRECAAGEHSARVVDQDIQTAEGIGLSATPVFIVDGRIHTGVPSREQLEDWLAAAR